MKTATEHFPPNAKVSLQTLVDAAQKIETPRMVQRWATVVAAFSMVVALLSLLSLVMLLPLKEYVPYFLVERSDASVVKSDQVGQRFVASDRNLVYFGWKFVKDLLTIDEQMRFRLPQTYEMTRGAALGQWQHFVGTYDRPQARLVEDPSLRRSVEPEGMPQMIRASAEARSGAMVFFVREIITSGRLPRTERRVKVTLDFVLADPGSDMKSIDKNPIGFYVTAFKYEVI